MSAFSSGLFELSSLGSDVGLGVGSGESWSSTEMLEFLSGSRSSDK